ncbi:MAG TPA: PQQ-binding-like beta-propeller repeat protein [Planctomycetota bacterium]|nr:PQQ-binding-like beta-propeller repeat protein [Planctomycetota bacterium]
MRIQAQVLAVLLASLAIQAEDSAVPPSLGSPGFQPTPDRPFGWRGDGSGRYPGATPVLEWSLTKNVRWSASVGKSYASPIVVGGLVAILSEPNLLFALDRATGKEVWRKEIAAGELGDTAARSAAEEYKAKDTGLAAATPVTDGSRIYLVLANGMVQAVDLSGKAAWTSFIDARQNTAYGRSASPILTDGKLIVHMTNLYAFDPSSGKPLWMNAEARCQYGTPAALRLNNANLIITPAGDVFSAADGKNLNTQIGNTSNASPVVQGGLVFFAEKDVRAIRLGADYKDESVWNGEIAGDVFGSPILHGGLLFTATGKGELIVFDAGKKGSVEPLFEARPLFGEEGAAQPIAYSSLTLAGSHLFLSSLTGDVVVLEATREARQVARNRLKEGSGSAPVFAGKDLFLRDGDRLYCIGE